MDIEVVTVLFAWMLIGLLGWGWMNYMFYSQRPETGESSDRWAVLVAALVVGPAFVLVAGFFAVLCLHEHRWGLRFR